jgi:hypothetical protein
MPLFTQWRARLNLQIDVRVWVRWRYLLFLLRSFALSHRWMTTHYAVETHTRMAVGSRQLVCIRISFPANDFNFDIPFIRKMMCIIRLDDDSLFFNEKKGRTSFSSVHSETHNFQFHRKEAAKKDGVTCISALFPSGLFFSFFNKRGERHSPNHPSM